MNFVDPQVIHQADMIVGVGIPRPLDLERAGRVAGRIAQVGVDAAELSFECVDGVEGIAAADAGDRRAIQPPAGDQQEREARPSLLVTDADIPFFVEASAVSVPTLLSEQ
jgi:hypothetical protein